MNELTREEHLQWCKQRALEYARMGANAQALASMGSDLGKHPETRNHIAIGLGMQMLISGLLDRPGEMEKFINGFN